MQIEELAVFDYMGGDAIKTYDCVDVLTKIIHSELTDGKYTRRFVADVLRHQENMEDYDNA